MIIKVRLILYSKYVNIFSDSNVIADESSIYEKVVLWGTLSIWYHGLFTNGIFELVPKEKLNPDVLLYVSTEII